MQAQRVRARNSRSTRTGRRALQRPPPVRAPMISPRPEIAERTVYEPQWPAEAFIVPLLRQLIEEGLRRYATPAPTGGRALDVGCGGQPFRRNLETLGYGYTGFDVRQNPAATVHVIGAIDAPLPEQLLRRGPFDCILCTEVLEHVARWDLAFTNLAQLLNPGGRLLVTCPHFYPPHEEPYDFWRPTANAVEFYAAAAGLDILELRRAGDAWDILGTLLTVTRCRAARPGWLDLVVTAMAQGQRRALMRVLGSSWLRRRVRLNSPLYLSVFAVCAKAP